MPTSASALLYTTFAGPEPGTSWGVFAPAEWRGPFWQLPRALFAGYTYRLNSAGGASIAGSVVFSVLRIIMAFSSQSNENKNPAPEVPVLGAADLDQEVQQALGGVSIEDLMAQSVAKGPSAPNLDPNRQVRGGRPSAGRKERGDRTAPDNIKHGKVIAIRNRNVFVDLGGKSEGICPLDQFDATVDEAGTVTGLEIGQEFDFVFKNYDTSEGLIILARLGAVTHGAWETLKPGDSVEGLVTGLNKGGLELRINNAKAFMPAGQVDTKFNADLSIFLNQKMSCIVTRVDRKDQQIVVSRRALVEAEEAKNAEKVWEEISEGQVREGTVRSVQPYGAFIDLGGVDGLLHVSAMSHTRVTDPKKIVNEGDKVQVMVLSVDKEKKRVALGLKQLSKDPWDTAVGQFVVGTIVSGTVKKSADFGAFVELAPGVEGLVHISQLSGKRVNKVSDVVKEGDIVKAKILQIDTEKKRISLSIAEAEREARQAEAIAKGEIPAPAAAATAAAPGAPAKPAKPPRKVPLKGGLG